MAKADHPVGIRVATWMRPGDETLFAAHFASVPVLVLENARTADVDLSQADGLLLTGGGDISASFLSHQEVSDPALIESVNQERDRWEMSAVLDALEREIPIFAICRGMQLLNVALGGSLHLHVEGHREGAQKDHDVQPLRYAPSVKKAYVKVVNSSHHQAIDRLGKGLIIEAWHADDGVIEQVRHTSHPWCLGVQYHPERGTAYDSLFSDFIDAIQRRL